MLGFITIFFCFGEVVLPALMLCIVYPFSRKAALFWSDYITCRCARIVFALLSFYRKFHFLGDRESLALLPAQFSVVSNHQSLFDIVVYLKYFGGTRTRFVAKDSLSSVPMVGKMLRSQGHCMIPRRGSPSVAMTAIDRFSRRVIQNNQIPVIFPEGTRSKDGKLGTFYAAGFRRLSESARLPVAVCALDGGWKISSLGSIITSLHRGAYRVKVLRVFPCPQSKEEEKHVLHEAARLIQEQLDKWRSLPAASLDV
ncbi:MAG: 1-acyl-sn-glycerol-3-phosphate acyltransferase [Treponema sp.]|nr:1-acyl-sn-glycerol-3-phosphate acyltransferase [Treponema sp.]